MANDGQIGIGFSIIGYGAMPIGEKMDLEDKQHFKTIAAVPVVQQEDWQSRQKRERSDLAPDPAYCLRRTEIMLSCYRKDETHNPEVYSSAVSAVLADGYSREIVDYVTDPRTGLPSRNKFLPSVAEVREACEMLTEPRRQHEDKLKRRAEQLDARDEWLKPPTGPRKTAAEILRMFEEGGFKFGSQKKRITVSPEEFMQRYGISRAEFDALGTSKAP
jgi:hypothetical protein